MNLDAALYFSAALAILRLPFRLFFFPQFFADFSRTRFISDILFSIILFAHLPLRGAIFYAFHALFVLCSPELALNGRFFGAMYSALLLHYESGEDNFRPSLA